MELGSTGGGNCGSEEGEGGREVPSHSRPFEYLLTMAAAISLPPPLLLLTNTSSPSFPFFSLSSTRIALSQRIISLRQRRPFRLRAPPRDHAGDQDSQQWGIHTERAGEDLVAHLPQSAPQCAAGSGTRCRSCASCVRGRPGAIESTSVAILSGFHAA